MNLISKLTMIALPITLAACAGGKPAGSTDDKSSLSLPTALTVSQAVSNLALESTSVTISGACEPNLGAVNLTIGTLALTAPCIDKKWSKDLVHSYFPGSAYRVTVQVSQPAQLLSTVVQHETLGYVCANSTSTQISDRNLTSGCNQITVNSLLDSSGFKVAQAIVSGCTSSCPAYDATAGSMTFAAGNSPVQVVSSADVSADEALTIYANFKWTGAGMQLSGAPAAMLMEKGQNDDDNYGIYFAGNQFCFEYNTYDVVYQSHCVPNVISMNVNSSVAVVYSYASQNVKMYVDGALKGTFTQAKRLRNNNFPVTVGQQNYAGNEFPLYGIIRNLTILNRSLSDSEVAMIHSVTNP